MQQIDGKQQAMVDVRTTTVDHEMLVNGESGVTSGCFAAAFPTSHLARAGPGRHKQPLQLPGAALAALAEQAKQASPLLRCCRHT
jgi:hypothetical protein